MISRKERAPFVQHLHELTGSQLFLDNVLEQERQAKSFERRLLRQAHVVENQWPIDPYVQITAFAVKLPDIQRP
ncbi:hypothetical protein D3C87_1581560 [compost metagenome]